MTRGWNDLYEISTVTEEHGGARPWAGLCVRPGRGQDVGAGPIWWPLGDEGTGGAEEG